MPDQPPVSEPQQPEPRIAVDGNERGVIRRGSMVIGHFELGADGHDTVVLDLGWCHLAGVNVRLLDDKSAGDNHRGGVSFERMAD